MNDYTWQSLKAVKLATDRDKRRLIGLYRENAIAVRVINRSAYDATSSVHAHRQRKNLSYLRNGCCIYYLRPPVLRTYKLKVEQTVFRHE